MWVDPSYTVSRKLSGKPNVTIVPVHDWQHWRSATSNALASLGTPGLEATCNQIVQFAETRFSRYSTTDELKRIRELKKLLLQCVKFKEKLERQGHRYLFWWSVSGRPFDDGQMLNITGETSCKDLVEYSLWPMLYIVMPRGHQVVERELVTTMPRPAQGIISESDSEAGSVAGSS